MQSVKVSSKRQITIPSDACRQLGITAGDRLSVVVRDDELVLHRRPATAFERLWGLGAHVWEGVDPVEHTRRLRDEFERGHDDDR
jgi:AbrB family looped-hinge helix DNA binding protein